jgi:cell shape-determining protein MreD
MSKRSKRRSSRTCSEKKEIRKLFLRRTLGILLLILCYVPMLGGGVQPLLSIPAAVLISMYDSAYFSMLVGVIAGLEIDLACAHPLGANAMFTVCFCTAVWLLCSRVIRPNFIYYFLLTTCCALMRTGIEYLVTAVIFQVDGREILWELTLFPSFVRTLIAALPIYLLYLPCIRLLTKRVKSMDAAVLRDSA